MTIRRGKHYVISKTGNYFVYERQLYQYVEGQKIWRFNKYSPSGQVSEFDQSQYYDAATGIPVAGAYPYAWRRYSQNKPDLSVPFEEAIWFKLYNEIQGKYVNIPDSQGSSLITMSKENVMFSEGTYLFFNGSVAGSYFVGEVDRWPTDWFGNYDGSGYMDAGMVFIDPSIPDDSKFSGKIIMFTIIFAGKYWNINTQQWQTEVCENSMKINGGAGANYMEFYDFDNMPPPVDPATGKRVPFAESVTGIWCKMPNAIGTLIIKLGAWSA